MSETLVPGWPQLWQSLLWTNEVALAKCPRLSTCFWVVGTIAKQRGKERERIVSHVMDFCRNQCACQTCRCVFVCGVRGWRGVRIRILFQFLQIMPGKDRVCCS